MPKIVRIAAIAASPLRVPDTQDLEACIQAEMAHWGGLLKDAMDDRPDLIVTPECCDRPLDMPQEIQLAYYHARGERMRRFFEGYARQHAVHIAYTAIELFPDGTARNAMRMINRQGGTDGCYHKNMVTSGEYEHLHALYGRDVQAIDTDVGRVCGAICFDLNFEEVLERTAAQRPDLVLFPSAYHGGFMQRYWAYRCRAHFVGAVSGTRTACIINPVGETVAQSSNYEPYVCASINLDCAVVHLGGRNPGKFKAVKAQYGPLVELQIPFGLGCALLTCHDPARTIADILAEFDMERWDEYYARSIAAREQDGAVEMNPIC